MGDTHVTKIFLTTSLLALATATSAFAATAASSDKGAEVSPVVITANRVPTAELKVASSITVITAADIAAKQEQTLPDVLKDVPGLNIVQTGGPGGQTSIFMRGTNSNHVKVIVDGIDVSDPSNANAAFDFGQFLTPDIERVEVLRGPQSGLYGSDAIGGVINIVTKSGEGPAKFTAGIEGGSFETFNQNAGVSGSTGPFHYTANVAHFRSGATPVTPLETLAPGEKRIDDSYDNLTFSTKLGYDVSDTFNLGLVARSSDTKLKLTGNDFSTFPAFPDSAQSTSGTKQYYTRATAQFSLFDGKFDETLGAAYSQIKSSNFSPDSGSSYNAGSRFKLDWQGVLKIADGETLVVGAEHEQDKITLPIRAGTSINSAYAELDSNLFTNFNSAISIRYDGNSRFGGATTYRIAPTYLIAATGTKLKASVGSGFKAPTLSELFQSFPPFFFANPNLNPEKSTGYDVGFEQFLMDNRVQFGATYYYNKIRDLITSNATFDSYANVGRAHTEGVEAFASYKPIDSLTVRVDYTSTKAKDDVLHQELLRRPHNKWNFDARWQATGKLSLDLNVTSVSSFIDGNRDFSISRLKAPGYTTADIAANYDLNAHITVYGRVTNLADEDYQNPTGFLRPGRGGFVGLKARF
jgi:vitamin B12 transporter